MRSLLIAFVVVAILGAEASAQDASRDWNRVHDPYVGAFGLSFGAGSGSGLALRWPALPQTMFTVTGAAWGKSGEIQWNLGLEAHYILRQAGRTRFFVGSSTAHYALNGGSIWNFGAGVGIEFLVWTRWALKTDLSFTWLGEEEAVYPLPQMGLLFYW